MTGEKRKKTEDSRKKNDNKRLTIEERKPKTKNMNENKK